MHCSSMAFTFAKKVVRDGMFEEFGAQDSAEDSNQESTTVEDDDRSVIVEETVQEPREWMFDCVCGLLDDVLADGNYLRASSETEEEEEERAYLEAMEAMEAKSESDVTAAEELCIPRGSMIPVCARRALPRTFCPSAKPPCNNGAAHAAPHYPTPLTLTPRGHQHVDWTILRAGSKKAEASTPASAPQTKRMTRQGLSASTPCFETMYSHEALSSPSISRSSKPKRRIIGGVTRTMPPEPCPRSQTANDNPAERRHQQLAFSNSLGSLGRTEIRSNEATSAMALDLGCTSTASLESCSQKERKNIQAFSRCGPVSKLEQARSYSTGSLRVSKSSGGLLPALSKKPTSVESIAWSMNVQTRSATRLATLSPVF